MMRRWINPFGMLIGAGLVVLLLGIGAQNFAQPGRPPAADTESQCSALLTAALESTDAQCSDTTRNQACYGHVLNLVSPRPDLMDELVFASQGDKVNLQDVASMELSPLDLVEERWGVVLMQVQANLPDSLPGQNVTFIMFGDVQIENAVGTPVEFTASVLAPSNIRVAPGETRPVLASLAAGESIIANGKILTSAGELWVRVNHDPDEEIYGWIRADLVDVALDGLPDVQSAEQPINPMQAFYFKTGIGQPQCEEAPLDGILIQTPKGAGMVDFKVNGMDIALGSTAYLTASNVENTSCVYLIEGGSDVSAADEGVSIQPGQRTCVELDENGIAVSPPSEPEAFDFEMVSLVAPMLDLLPEEVELPEEQPTNVPTRTSAPVVAPRNTAMPTPTPSITPTDFVFPTSTSAATATSTPTSLPPCPSDGTSAPPCLPVSDFNYAVLYAVSDRTVRFNNLSYGDITSYHWNFGDGNTSTEIAPTHTYANYGCYTVRLRVDNPYGFDRMTLSFDLLEPTATPIPPTATATVAPPPTPPIAAFTHTLNGFDFTYTDTSTPGSSPIAAISWDFGDGASGTGASGTHTFAAGTYTITQTVTDTAGLSDTSAVTLTFGACTFSTSNSTTLTVTREVGDPPGTVYNIYLKNPDCSLPGTPVGILSVSNPNFSTGIFTGQHYLVQQVQLCSITTFDGMAGTAPISLIATNICP